MTALESVTSQVNVRLKGISPSELLRAAQGVDDTNGVYVHALLTEVPLEHVKEMMTCEEVSVDQLRMAVDGLPASMKADCIKTIEQL